MAAGKAGKVRMPGRTLPEREVAEARGHADAAALKLRYHNAVLHARHAPADATARAVFNAAEQARAEALGARAMEGVRANLPDRKSVVEGKGASISVDLRWCRRHKRNNVTNLTISASATTNTQE